jgi:hypothetical protein
MAAPAAAMAHVERPSDWPHYPGQVPQYRAAGPSIVVCQPDSGRRIRRLPNAKMRAGNLALLRRCSTHEIQTAVNRARNGTRILLLPGVYTEPTSRRYPDDPARCRDLMVQTAEGSEAPGYAYQRTCPNAKNLIAIVGDSDGDRRCDDKCRIQITGTARVSDVLIKGDRHKLNVIRADRADGVYLGDFTIQYSDFNNVYVLETNGFHVNNIRTRWSREYGVLSFASEAGLYENLDAYGSGDSGVYPGSGPQGLASERACQTYGIEIRHVDSHHNNMGYSGTAGDSVWIHDNRFHHNAAGMATDSFAAGHPGMPQHCGKYTHNAFYSNNMNVFTPARQEYCRKPAQERDPKVVCSAFQVPVGTGMLIAGGNQDIVADNWNWDNWRYGFMLFWVPAAARGETDPAKQIDTSFDDHYVDNRMGVVARAGAIRAGVRRHPIEAIARGARTRGQRTRGQRTRGHRRPAPQPIAFTAADIGPSAPNGLDFWWDEEGAGNCWSGNFSQSGPGNGPVSDPATLPDCPGSRLFSPGRLDKLAAMAPCATWDPQTNPFPPGCDWFTTPPQPTRERRSSGPTLPTVSVPGVTAARTLRVARRGAGGVAWASAPRLLRRPLLPHDRIVVGEIVNTTDAPVELEASRLRVLWRGHALRSDAVFLSHFMHRLWPFNKGPSVRPLVEQYRTGVRARIEPGERAPLTVAWRSRAGHRPARLTTGSGWLPLASG